MLTRTWLTAVLLLGSFISGPVRGQFEPPTDADFAEQIKRLDPKVADKAGRLKALGWINGNSLREDAALAVPALERCLRDDPVWEVRQQAVLALGLIARDLDRPCPLPILEALHDPEDFVRYQAAERAGLFTMFPPGALEALLRGVRADNPELRSTSLLLLPRVAGKDPKAQGFQGG